MMISRLMRGRLSSSVRTLRREISSIAEHESLPFRGAQRGYCIYGLLGANSAHGSTSLTTLKHLQPVLLISCRKYQVQKIVGLTFATSCLAAWNGNAEVVSCEQVEVGKSVPPVQQTLIKVEEEKDSEVVVVPKYLWLTALVTSTVVIGYYFPYSLRMIMDLLSVPFAAVLLFPLVQGFYPQASLVISGALLLWSMKPTANSIYDWVERVRILTAFVKRRLQEAVEMQKIAKLGFNLDMKATVMQVEVRDYTLFCHAEVSSMTQTATLVGFLRGWFVIYSSSAIYHPLCFEKIPEQI